MRVKQILIVILLFSYYTGLQAQDLIIKEVLYNPSMGNDKLQICNTTSGTIDITTYYLCALFSYPRLDDTRFTIINGSTNLAANSCVTIDLGTWDLNDSASDLGLFSSNAFGTTGAMVDFVIWGQANLGREGVAVNKGIWQDNTFVPTALPGQSLQFDCTNGGGGDLSLTSDFTNAAPTADLASVTIVQIKTILQGPYNGTDMNTDLLSNGLLSTMDPYGLGETASSIPADVVDWVKVELRDATNNTSVLATRACFLRKDGELIELDGTVGVRFSGLTASSAFVAIMHRNHLSVMTSSAVSL